MLLPLLLTQNIVDDLTISLIDGLLPESNIDKRDLLAVEVSQSCAHRLHRATQLNSQRRPRMARPVSRNTREQGNTHETTASAPQMASLLPDILEGAVLLLQEVLITIFCLMMLKDVEQIFITTIVLIDDIPRLWFNLNRIVHATLPRGVLNTTIDYVRLPEVAQIHRTDATEEDGQLEHVDIAMQLDRIVRTDGIVHPGGEQLAQLVNGQGTLHRLGMPDLELIERIVVGYFQNLNSMVEDSPDVPHVDSAGIDGWGGLLQEAVKGLQPVNGDILESQLLRLRVETLNCIIGVFVDGSCARGVPETGELGEPREEQILRFLPLSLLLLTLLIDRAIQEAIDKVTYVLNVKLQRQHVNVGANLQHGLLQKVIQDLLLRVLLVLMLRIVTQTRALIIPLLRQEAHIHVVLRHLSEVADDELQGSCAVVLEPPGIEIIRDFSHRKNHSHCICTSAYTQIHHFTHFYTLSSLKNRSKSDIKET